MGRLQTSVCAIFFLPREDLVNFHRKIIFHTRLVNQDLKLMFLTTFLQLPIVPNTMNTFKQFERIQLGTKRSHTFAVLIPSKDLGLKFSPVVIIPSYLSAVVNSPLSDASCRTPHSIEPRTFSNNLFGRPAFSWSPTDLYRTPQPYERGAAYCAWFLPTSHLTIIFSHDSVKFGCSKPQWAFNDAKFFQNFHALKFFPSSLF